MSVLIQVSSQHVINLRRYELTRYAWKQPSYIAYAQSGPRSAVWEMRSAVKRKKASRLAA